MVLINCKNCGKKAEHHAKQMCITCYKKTAWKPKLIKCKRCGRELPMHAKGLCDGCYNSVFHIDKVKEQNVRRYHNIEPELYKKITKKCVICEFDKVIDLHHLDNNSQNNFESNLIGLCPNHHKMIHNRFHRKEVLQILKERGFNPPEGYKDDEFFK